MHRLITSAAATLLALACIAADQPERRSWVCVSNERSVESALDFAQSQLEGGIGILTDRGVDPTVEVANYELGGVDREGDISDRLTALSDYLTAFLKSRILAYLGGFPKAGLE